MAGKRYSRQRELIYQCVQSTKEHPSAEMVYQWLKPTNPGLSLGTVYRNLNLLSGEGMLVRLRFSVDRYDADLHSHAHLHCQQCGRVVDLNGDCSTIGMVFEKENPAVEVVSCRLICEGVCEVCRSNPGA